MMKLSACSYFSVLDKALTGFTLICNLTYVELNGTIFSLQPEEASRMRVKCAWGKFSELSPILTAKRGSLKLNKMTRLLSGMCMHRIN